MKGEFYEAYRKYLMVHFGRCDLRSFMVVSRCASLHKRYRNTLRSPMLQGRKALICAFWKKGRSQPVQAYYCERYMGTFVRLGTRSCISHSGHTLLYYYIRHSQRYICVQIDEACILPLRRKGKINFFLYFQYFTAYFL